MDKSFWHLSERFFFFWRFILNENIFFWMSIFYQKPLVFSVSVFCSQIFTVKLNLRLKIDLTYAISIVNWFYIFFVLENIFFIFLQQRCENFRKIKQAELVENLPPSYLPYRFLHNLHSFLLWGKVKIFDFLKTNDCNKTFVHRKLRQMVLH